MKTLCKRKCKQQRCKESNFKKFEIIATHQCKKCDRISDCKKDLCKAKKIWLPGSVLFVQFSSICSAQREILVELTDPHFNLRIPTRRILREIGSRFQHQKYCWIPTCEKGFVRTTIFSHDNWILRTWEIEPRQPVQLWSNWRQCRQFDTTIPTKDFNLADFLFGTLLAFEACMTNEQKESTWLLD